MAEAPDSFQATLNLTPTGVFVALVTPVMAPKRSDCFGRSGR